MKTRCKFVVNSVTKHGGGGTSITASPVYSTDPNHENKTFWEATPSGEFKVYVNNASLDAFAPGTEFYVDLTPCEAKA